MKKLKFFGKCHPDRCGGSMIVNLNDWSDGVYTIQKMYMNLLGSSFHGYLIFDETVPIQTHDANEFITSVIGPYFKINGLFDIANYQIDVIRGYLDNDSEVAEYTCANICYNSIRTPYNQSVWNEISNALGSDYGPLFRLAINDFASATTDKDMCAFLCYRAFEALRNIVSSINGLNEKSNGWEKLRELLRLEKESLSKIKAFADEVRHGRFSTAPQEERTNFLKLTRDSIIEIARTVNKR